MAIGLSAICIGGAVAAGVGSAVDGIPFQNSHIETWFNSWGKGSQNSDSTAQSWGGVVDDVGNDMNSEITYAMPTAMSFYSTFSSELASRLSSPSVTVTCSHNFEFNNVLVDWSVEYPSGASAADVVTVTPIYDGSLIATVSCITSFDTQLILRATLRSDPQISATCTVDYIRRIESISNTKIGGSDAADGWWIELKPVLGIGTVNGDLWVSSISFYLTEDFKQYVRNYLTFDIEFLPYGSSEIALSYDSDYWVSDEIDILSYDMFIEGFDDYDEAHKEAIYYAWFTAYNDYRQSYYSYYNGTIDITIEVLYNGVIINKLAESDLTGCFKFTGSAYGSDLSPVLNLNNGIAL